MKYLFFLVLLSCAHREAKLTDKLKDQLVSDHQPQQGMSQDKIHPTLKTKWMEKFWQVSEAGDLLQNTEGATASVSFKLKSLPTGVQDLVAFSVGSDNSSFLSRLSIRLEDGQIKAILRASDQDASQEILSTGAALRVGEWHRVTLTVDYSNNSASFYLDGHKLETTGTLQFGSKKTADTPSASMAIGSEDDGSNFFFQGEIGRVLIWRRALSTQEVYQL